MSTVLSIVCYPNSDVTKRIENDLTHWSTFINHMVYYMYTLDARVNDLTRLVNDTWVTLLHMSLYVCHFIENEWSYIMIHVDQKYGI